MCRINLGGQPDAKPTGKGWFKRCNGARSWLCLARSVDELAILCPIQFNEILEEKSDWRAGN
jgi:hypothetical protein